MKYPKSVNENLALRRKVCLQAEADPIFRQSILDQCAEDILFWANLFVWTHDPRLVGTKEHRDVPFITYPFQDDGLIELKSSFGTDDMVVVKSRDVGATCVIAGILYPHAWLFMRSTSMGMVSREASLVDGSQKSLFAKVDYTLSRLPRWMMPGDRQTEPKGKRGYFRKEYYLKNLRNGSVIEGTTTTENMFRGDRYTSILWDEMAAGEQALLEKAFAATSKCTNNRIMISTPQGQAGPFYKVATNPKIKKMKWLWTDHPIQSRGMENRLGRPPHGPQGEWSPYFQKECERLGMVDWMIAQELNGDFIGSGRPFFDITVLEKLIQDDGQEPLDQGFISEDKPGEYRFCRQEGGPLRLWAWMRDGKLPDGSYYAIGVDTSWGVGKTNSVASVIDLATGEKVAEFASPKLPPEEFAVEVRKLAKFFHNAYVIWETNGPGAAMGKKLIELGHLNVYYRRNEQSLSFKEKDVPGWPATPQNQWVLFSQYRAALASGKFKNHSRDALEEAKLYQFLAGNKIGNPSVHTSHDKAGATVLHGDRVTADALANKAFVDQGEPNIETPENYTPNRQHYDYRTFIGRRIMSEMEKEEAAYW